MVSSNGNSVAQKFGYNGKELNEELGLEWHDFGARNYNASLGRWMNIDPMAEKYYDKSSYVYTLNNPVFFIDPDGREVDVSDLWNRIKNEKNEGDADDARWILAQLVSGLSDISGIDIGFKTDDDGKTTLNINGPAGQGKWTEEADYVRHILGDETSFTVKLTDGGSEALSTGLWLDAGQINGMQEGLEEYGFEKNTMSVAMAFIHETLHYNDGAKFFNSKEDNNNKSLGAFRDEQYTTQIVNRFRESMNLPTLYSYGTKSTMFIEKEGERTIVKKSKNKPTVDSKTRKVLKNSNQN